MKTTLLIVAILFLSTSTLACQYNTTTDIIENRVSQLFVDRVLQENPTWIDFKTTYTHRSESPIFVVHNNLNIPINITIRYEYANLDNPPYTPTETQPITVQANNIYPHYHDGARIQNNSIQIIYHDNDDSRAKWLNIYKTECDQCSGVNCLDDGQQCSLGRQCGGEYCNNGICANQAKANGESCELNDECIGKYCVSGKCNNRAVCYNRDCDCADNEIECSDKTRCVAKDSVSIGAKPICNIEECKPETYKDMTRKYLDNGFCATHPDIISYIASEEEKARLALENQQIAIKNQQEMERIALENEAQRKNTTLYAIIIGILLIGIIVTVIIIYHQKKEIIEAGIKKTRAEIEKIDREIDKINLLFKDLDSLQDKIKKLNAKKQKTEKECDEIATLKERYAQELNDIENEHKIVMNNLQEAKSELERKLAELKKAMEDSKKTSQEREDLIKKRDDIKELRQQIAALQVRADRDAERLNKKKEENTKILNEKEAALIKYRRRYGDKHIDINSDGYLFFTKTNYLLHRQLYWGAFWNEPGYENISEKYSPKMEIHHIDGDRLNNELYNLIALPKEKHKELVHYKIETGDWQGGLNVLTKYLNWSETDLPPHIRKHLNTLKHMNK